MPWQLQNNIIWGKSIEVDGRVRGYSTPTTSKRYLQNGWEHLFHFTKDGDTEIDLKWSGVPYNEEYNNAARNLKRSGRDWRPTTNCWHITYQSKATKEITKEIAGDRLIIQADGIPMSGGKDNFNTTLQAVATAEVIILLSPAQTPQPSTTASPPHSPAQS